VGIFKKVSVLWRVSLVVFLVGGGLCLEPAVQASKAPENDKMVTSTHKLGSFDSIVISGNIKVVLLPSHRSGSHSLTMTSPSTQSYSIDVKNSVLSIRQITPWWITTQSATVKVDVSTLKKLSLFDAAAVSATSFKTSSLTIDADTSGDINLDGQVGLKSLILKGPGNVHVRWVDTPSLNIDSHGDGAIDLSGTVGQMHVRLSGHSQLEAENLRADSIAIQTYHFAKAQVMPMTTLNAFAHDFSNILYYRTPKYFTRFTSQSGNILQMQWRES
tara:strand:+ start:6610 stop:7428 length:819 start_codon:yes stop_codon:yes gene_type:complete